MRYFRLFDPFSPIEGSLYRCDGTVFEYEVRPGEWSTSDVKQRHAHEPEAWFDAQVRVWGPDVTRWEEIECPVS